jgi:acetyltransferase-like isoleucine patch superfamily enzyme
VITRVNETRHRLRFRLWTALLRLQLRRRGAGLVVEAPHGARMATFPHVAVDGRGGTLRLRIGRGVKLGRATHLDLQLTGGDCALEIGDGAYLMHGVRLQLRGGAIRLGAHVNLRDGVVLKSEGELVVGYGVPISYGCAIHCVERIDIAGCAGLAERVTVVDSDHTHYGDERYFLANPLKVAPVHIGANAFVCANAVITRGARVGANSVIGAGAVVGEGEHPDGWLVAGVPARPVRALGDAAGTRPS